MNFDDEGDAQEYLSPYRFVDSETPPTFLMHGTADEGVRTENSEWFYDSLVKYGVDAVLHLLPGVSHGGGMSGCNDSCLAWLERQGYLDETSVAGEWCRPFVSAPPEGRRSAAVLFNPYATYRLPGTSPQPCLSPAGRLVPVFDLRGRALQGAGSRISQPFRSP